MAQENKVVANASTTGAAAAGSTPAVPFGMSGTFGPMTGAPAIPPPLPPAAQSPARAEFEAPGLNSTEDGEPQPRRQARRRAAGPTRGGPAAANDDSPSIGGLIYALEQKPSNKPFMYAGLASAIWAAIAVVFLWAMAAAQVQQGETLSGILSQPTAFLTLAGVVVPIAVLWFLALLAWRSEELRLRSSAMTEVAVRLAEPDRMAEQSVASLGQAVRRQVAFMNDAVSRALGRAGELEALVHNEVSALERSYEDNERKIRALIGELAGERHAITNTSGQVAETLKQLGTDIPALIDKLSNQQVKLAHIIQGAGENLNALEMAVGQSRRPPRNDAGHAHRRAAGRARRLHRCARHGAWQPHGADSGRARELHGDVGWRARLAHGKSAGRVRGICPRARHHVRQPRRGFRFQPHRTHTRARRGLQRAPQAVRRIRSRAPRWRSTPPSPTAPWR